MYTTGNLANDVGAIAGLVIAGEFAAITHLDTSALAMAILGEPESSSELQKRLCAELTSALAINGEPTINVGTLHNRRLKELLRLPATARVLAMVPVHASAMVLDGDERMRDLWSRSHYFHITATNGITYVGQISYDELRADQEMLAGES